MSHFFDYARVSPLERELFDKYGWPIEWRDPLDPLGAIPMNKTRRWEISWRACGGLECRFFLGIQFFWFVRTLKVGFLFWELMIRRRWIWAPLPGRKVARRGYQ